MNLPLKFLNIIEHSSKSNSLNLSGNLRLGERDEMLEEYINEEALRNKNRIKEGRALLDSLKERATKASKNEVTILQIRGDVVETILKSQGETAVLVIGIASNKEHKIGDNVKDIIRAIHKPILLVNSEYVEPKKLLIAYNGSSQSKKLLHSTSIRPIFKDIKRDIVNVNDDKRLSEKLLNEAKEIFSKQNIEVSTSVLSGDPKDEVLNYFEKNSFDILAMGAFGQPRLKEVIFGSFTTNILAKIDKPILLLR